MHRVQKLISNFGYCSRRQAEKLIGEKRVKVKGKLVKLGDQASENDTITVDGKPIKKERRVYLMFHKPVGCVSANMDRQHKTVLDYVKIKERVFPIGRLDYNTSGLLLLTNDGDFANKVMHPRYEVKKTYVVEVDKPIIKKIIKNMEEGVELEDGVTSPAKVRKLDDKTLEITIHEGKNRVVRRMLKTLGFRVKTLHRIRIGKLFLGDLKLGRYRKLGKKEMNGF